MSNTELCPYRAECGGCQLQGTPYAEQLRLKQRRIEALLGGFGEVSPIVGAEEPLHYRNKAHAVFALDRQRQPVAGFYRPGTHAVVPVDACLIEDEQADRILQTVLRLVRELKIPVYDERSGRGWLRHALVRRGAVSGQALLILVAASPIFRGQRLFLSKLLSLHPEIVSVVLNVNDRFGPVVLGKTNKTLYGSGFLEDALCSLRFRLSPGAFYQINHAQAEKLYALAISFCALTGRETLLDAYCGVGTIGLCAAASAGRVIGVELNRDAVRDAIANARLNGIENARFVAGDAGEYMESMLREGLRPDVVLLDPPREGCSRRFLDSLVRCAPPRVVYVSCGPDSLRRDLERLTQGGFRVEKICPVDMFPYTEHVETVVLLTKNT